MPVGGILNASGMIQSSSGAYSKCQRGGFYVPLGGFYVPEGGILSASGGDSKCQWEDSKCQWGGF